jgi:heptosyltransferase II
VSSWLIQTAFLGDCILTLPLLARLAESAAGRIDVITSRAGEELFKVALERGLNESAPRIRLHFFDKKGAHRKLGSLRRFAREIAKDTKPDQVFCVQRSLRTAALAWLSGAPERVGYSSGAATFLYSNAVRRDWASGRHEIERNLDLLRASGEDVAPWDPKSAPSLLKGRHASKATHATVAIAVGSPWATKRWPVEHVAKLVNHLCEEGIDVKLLGDASSLKIAEEVRAAVPSLLLKNLVGKTSIREWIDEIASSSVLVSGDSAAVHAASDLNIPVVALFGPTLPEFGFAPWRRGSYALGLTDLPCRPCHIHGPPECPLGHHRCLRDLSPKWVHETVREFLPASAL